MRSLAFPNVATQKIRRSRGHASATFAFRSDGSFRLSASPGLRRDHLQKRGEILLLKFAQDLEEFGVVESMPKLEGKRMIMFIIPKKKK